MSERILAAAVWIDDDRPHPYQPTATGYVLCGHRHHVCIALAQLLVPPGTVEDTQRRGHNQGFLTSSNRFVFREEAARIALAAGQIPKPRRLLFSEDLW